MAKISKAKRQFIFARDIYTCRKCGVHIPPELGSMPNPDKKLWILEIDHIVPLVENGSNDYGNLQTLCNRCNCRKNCTPNSPFMAGKEIKYDKF